MHGKTLPLLAALLTAAPVAQAVDQNNNQQSDVWEMLFQSPSLPAGGDFDADGWSNAAESSAGTNPLAAASFPAMALHLAAGLPTFSWLSLQEKHYALLTPDHQRGRVLRGNGTLVRRLENRLASGAAEHRALLQPGQRHPAARIFAMTECLMKAASFQTLQNQFNQ